ncbi:MAG: hemin uptake protein HemP [Planctomycetota bacterium]
METIGSVSEHLVAPSGGTVPPRGSVAVATFPRELPVVDSVELLRGHTMVQIRHGNALYRLGVTSNGKLILTK